LSVVSGWLVNVGQMNAISAPLKRIRDQLRAPGADQSHVSKLSANAQRDLSLLKEHKSIKKARTRVRTTALQQQQHSQPESPIQLMTRFRYQPHSDTANPSAGPLKNVPAGLVSAHEALEAPVAVAPTRSSRKPGRLPKRGVSPEQAGNMDGGGVPVGESGKAQTPQCQPGSIASGINSGLSPQTTGPASTMSPGGATVKRAVWHRCLGYGDGTEVLPDSISRQLELAMRSGWQSVTVRRGDQDFVIELFGCTGRMRDISSETGEEWEVFRDDFGDMDFYGRKEFLARFRQSELLRIRQRREDRRLKRMRHKAPAHCHIWHNPNSEEVGKIPCQFPAETLQQSLRRIVAFGAGARHVTECNDAPSLEEALPEVSLTYFDLRRPGGRKMSVRVPVAQAQQSTAPPPETGCSSTGDEGQEGDTECQKTEGSTVQLPAIRGTQTSLLGSTTSGGNKRPRTPDTRMGKHVGGEATSSSGEDEVGSPDCTGPPTTPAPRKEGAEAGEEDETAYHGHQLFANNFAGIRQLISEMNEKGNLFHLEPQKDKRKKDDSSSPRKDPKSPPRQASPPKSVQTKGEESEDEWGGASSGEEDERRDVPPSHVLPNTASKQRDLEQWYKQLMSWQGPLDIRADEEGSESSGDNDYDPNCTICRMYDARGPDSPTSPAARSVGQAGAAPSGSGWVRREERGRVYYERQGDNPYLQKIQEWKNLQYSAKLQVSLRLHDTLDERDKTKAYAMQSPVCIAQLGRAAETNARQWETGRFTSGPGAADIGIPTIWNNASTHLRLERHRAAQCIVLYTRLLYYVERIGGLTTQGQVDLVNRVRKLLIHEGRVSRRVFFDLLRDAGPDVVESRENMKILHYLRIELSLSSGDLIRFIRRNKNRGWYFTRDLQILADKLKKREQSGRGR